MNSIRTYTLDDALRAMEFVVYGNPTEEEIKLFKEQCKANIPFKMKASDGVVFKHKKNAKNTNLIIGDAASYYNRENAYLGD